MKSSHDFRLQKQQNKLQEKEMDKTDMFFLSMSKALKKLPSLDQSKIKLYLHTAIAQAQIRILEAQDRVRRTPINVTRQVDFPSTSSFSFLSPTSIAPMMETPTLEMEQQNSHLAEYYSNVQFS